MMPFQPLGMGQAQMGQQGPLPISPGLVIGIGGTGKEVLWRVRRRFFERYHAPGLPIVSYLWIDTDTRNRNIKGQALDFVFQEVDFSADEKVDAGILRQAYKAYFTNTPGHVARWYYPELGRFGSMLDGAGGIRPKGRLGFFHAYPQVRRQVLSQFQQATIGTSIAAAQEMGLEIEPEPANVFIVCSLAGGTGAGMFLDCAFLARKELRDAGIIGFLVLPGPFRGLAQGDRVLANAYAALKELEFYSLRKDLAQRPGVGAPPPSLNRRGAPHSFHDFEAQWAANVPPEFIPGPPFDFCYLVDNRHEHGTPVTYDNIEELFEMVAESIYLEFDPGLFAAHKRSVRVNLEQFLLTDLHYTHTDNNDRHLRTDIFANRYMSFGLSRMFLPVERIRSACAYRLAKDLAAHWIDEDWHLDPQGQKVTDRQNAPPANLRDHVENQILGPLRMFLPVSSDGRRTENDFTQALQVADDSGNTFFALITKWQVQEKGNLATASPSAPSSLANRVRQARKQFYDTNLDRSDPNPQRHGAFVRRIHDPATGNAATFVRTRTEGEVAATGNVVHPGIEQDVAKRVDSPFERAHVVIPKYKEVAAVLEQYEQRFRKASAEAGRLAQNSLRLVGSDENVIQEIEED